MTTTTKTKVDTFEELWGAYIDKLARLDELKAAGRYGYQLRMPKKAIEKAYFAMRDWCASNGVECP